jgi:Putative restriction endonuclease
VRAPAARRNRCLIGVSSAAVLSWSGCNVRTGFPVLIRFNGPVPQPARRLATWDDLVRTPDDGQVYEVLDGNLVRKVAMFLRAGVTHYWILDPADRTLEAFEASAGHWLRLGAWTDGGTPRVAPFEAIELEVAGFFLPRLP